MILSAPWMPTSANTFLTMFSGPNGLLKEKARILVTHAVKFLPQTDWIAVMREGSIAEQGTYGDLNGDAGRVFALCRRVQLGASRQQRLRGIFANLTNTSGTIAEPFSKCREPQLRS